MFYVLFGIVLGNASDRRDNATYMLATMGCFGTMAVALFGFGVSLAMERGQGWLQVKRASPMPVSAYFLAKLFAAVVFSTVIMLLLLSVGSRLEGYVCRSQPRWSWSAFWSQAQYRQRNGSGHRIFRQAKLRASRGQPDLLTDVVLLGIMDSAVRIAAWIAGAGHHFAALSPQPVGAECSRDGTESDTGVGTRRGVTGVHPAVPGPGRLGLSSRRRKAVRMRKAALRLRLWIGNGS